MQNARVSGKLSLSLFLALAACATDLPSQSEPKADRARVEESGKKAGAGASEDADDGTGASAPGAKTAPAPATPDADPKTGTASNTGVNECSATSDFASCETCCVKGHEADLEERRGGATFLCEVCKVECGTTMCATKATNPSDTCTSCILEHADEAKAKTESSCTSPGCKAVDTCLSASRCSDKL